MAVPSKGFTLYKSTNGIWLPALNNGFGASFNDGIPKGGLSQVYVRARAITCPIFRCFVCLCEIVSANCQPSCISKHPYMHNHAFYMLMHLIKLLCWSYTFAFSIPMIISVKINHVNFKPLLSCQFQAPAVVSANFNLFLQYNLFLLTAKWPARIQEQLVPVNLLLFSVKWLVRIQEQLAPVNSLSFLLPVKWLVQIQEQLVPVLLCLLSAKRLVQIQEQLVLPTLLLSSAKRLVQLQKNSLCPSACQFSRSSSQFEPKERLALVDLLSVSPVNFVICYLVNVYQSRNGYDIPCYLLSCQCLPVPQWIRHILLNSTPSLSCIHNPNVAWHAWHLQMCFYAQNQCKCRYLSVFVLSSQRLRLLTL